VLEGSSSNGSYESSVLRSFPQSRFNEILGMGVLGFSSDVRKEADDEATYRENSSEKRTRVLVLSFSIA
jgi:hypothetical protein